MVYNRPICPNRCLPTRDGKDTEIRVNLNTLYPMILFRLFRPKIDPKPNCWLAVAPKLDEIQGLRSTYILQLCILAMHHPKGRFPAPLV